MSTTRFTPKQIGLLSSVLAVILAIWWGNRVNRVEEAPLPKVEVPIPDPPKIGETVVWNSMASGAALDSNVKGLERDLIEAYQKFSFVPPTSHLLFNAPADFRTDRSGLAEVRRLIQPGSEIEFLGVLNAEEYLYPGRIISITPIARPDYVLPPSNLQGLALHPHKVYAAAITAKPRTGSGLPSGTDLLDGAKQPLRFNEAEIPAGKQDQTGSDYQKFLQQLNGQGGNASNGHTVFIYKTANTLEEGYQKLGINASYGAASFVGSTRTEHRADQQHVFIMLKQEFFRVHSDSIGDSPHVLTARVQATQENVDEFKKLGEWKRTTKSQIPYQDVPAVIKSVTYGRIVILASEDASYSESDLNSFVAQYSSPTASVKIDFENALKKLLKRSTFKIVTWGGGPLKFPKKGSPTETLKGDGMASSISHEFAAEIMSDAAEANVTWDPEHPGRAIGFAAYYLDQSGTQAHSFSLSDKNLLATQGGYPTDAKLAFHCGNDHDGFLFFDQTGEWEFRLKTTGDPDEHAFGKFTDINDGASKPQYRYTHRMAGLSYTQPLTITVWGKEDGDGNWETYPIEFDESKLRPVPDEFDRFSTGSLRDLTKSVSRLSDRFSELRKLGDLHKVSRKNAESAGGEYLAAWNDALTKVKEVHREIAIVRKQHTATREAWLEVKTALEGHKLAAESTTSPNKFAVELVPHSSATIATVEGVLDSLERTIEGIEEGLK